MTERRRRRARPARASLDGPRSPLAGLLADLRAARGFTLRQVEEATDHAVSNAYLSQLEQGKVRQPSPNVLYSLAAVYAVPSESLMERAGYLRPSREGERRRRLAAFALNDLSPEEEAELRRYLAFIRWRAGKRAQRGRTRSSFAASSAP